MYENRKKLILPAIIITTFFIVIIAISILGMNGFFHHNPYGNELVISNFNSYYRDTPTTNRDMLFSILYNQAALNVENNQNVPTSGAKIRKDSALSDYNKETNIYNNNFIVDIEPIKQSFKVWFQWSPNENNMYLSGYQVSILCLEGEESLYNSTDCKDSSKDNDLIANLYAKYPNLSKFPIDVSTYTNNYADYIQYKITFSPTNDDQDIEFTVTDYTGGNYERALAKLSELGFSTSKFKIIYDANDELAQPPAKAPDDEPY